MTLWYRLTGREGGGQIVFRIETASRHGLLLLLSDKVLNYVNWQIEEIPDPNKRPT